VYDRVKGVHDQKVDEFALRIGHHRLAPYSVCCENAASKRGSWLVLDLNGPRSASRQTRAMGVPREALSLIEDSPQQSGDAIGVML